MGDLTKRIERIRKAIRKTKEIGQGMLNHGLITKSK